MSLPILRIVNGDGSGLQVHSVPTQLRSFIPTQSGKQNEPEHLPKRRLLLGGTLAIDETGQCLPQLAKPRLWNRLRPWSTTIPRLCVVEDRDRALDRQLMHLSDIGVQRPQRFHDTVGLGFAPLAQLPVLLKDLVSGNLPERDVQPVPQILLELISVDDCGAGFEALVAFEPGLERLTDRDGGLGILLGLIPIPPLLF